MRHPIRSVLLKETMQDMRGGYDPQSVVVKIYQDERAIHVWPDDEKREQIANGILAFCEHALGYSR